MSVLVYIQRLYLNAFVTEENQPLFTAGSSELHKNITSLPDSVVITRLNAFLSSLVSSKSFIRTVLTWVRDISFVD